MRINSEDGLSKLESDSFHLPHIELLGTLRYWTTKLGMVIDM